MILEDSLKFQWILLEILRVSFKIIPGIFSDSLYPKDPPITKSNFLELSLAALNKTPTDYIEND